MSDHAFNPFIAKKYGINEAIIINSMIFWTRTNAAEGKNFHENRFWSYGTPEYYSKYFPYFTERQIKYALSNLVKIGALLKSNFNKKGYDKTAWYSLSDSILIELNLDITCLHPAPTLIEQNCPIDRTKLSYGRDKIVLPIPDTKTDTKKDKKLTNCKTPSSSSFIFSKTIDKKLLDEKLTRDERTTDEFLKECVDHVDNCSDKKFPRLQRAGALVKLLKQMKESDMIFREVCKETKKQKERSNETDQERMNRQYAENEIEKEARDPTYQSKFLEKERKLQQTKPGYKSKFL